MNDLYRVLFQAMLSFFVLFLLSKILGKKQVAQLEFIDYVVGISIGSIAAQMAIEPQIPWFHFVVAMSIYAFFDLGITLISRKSNLLKRLFKGRPLIIIAQGKINYKNLKKNKLDLNELISQCRVKGCFNLNEINYAIFEPSGDFSILLKGENLNVVNKDLKIEKTSQILSTNLILDGKIIEEELIKYDKDVNWLLSKTKLKNIKEIKKKILLFTYLPSDDTFSIFEK